MKKMIQRKVLILSGITHMIDAVKTANKMGIYTIVADNGVGSPAKAFADKAYDISSDDTARLSDIVKDEQVDGIFTAFNDIDTWNALKLCKKMDLPFYVSLEKSAISANKEKFKEFCQTFNISIIEENEVEDKIWGTIEFPVLVTSADSFANHGTTVCYN